MVHVYICLDAALNDLSQVLEETVFGPLMAMWDQNHGCMEERRLRSATFKLIPSTQIEKILVFFNRFSFSCSANPNCLQVIVPRLRKCIKRFRGSLSILEVTHHWCTQTAYKS